MIAVPLKRENRDLPMNSNIQQPAPRVFRSWPPTTEEDRAAWAEYAKKAMERR